MEETTTTTERAAARPQLIRTRRSCIGCGQRPGELYANGLCDPCQFPHASRDFGAPA